MITAIIDAIEIGNALITAGMAHEDESDAAEVQIIKEEENGI